MIPHIYPSVINVNNQTEMVVFPLASITGLTRWVDYIPAKQVNAVAGNTFANNDSILTNVLANTTNKQAWVDYIPIYVDAAATTPWVVSAVGYIPMNAVV